MNERKKAAVIQRIVDRLHESGWIGKTHVQKAVLFAQDAAGIDLGFRYVIHHYGPYSFELANFMDSLDREGLLQVSRAPDGYGYEVSRGEVSAEETIDETTLKKIDLLVSQLRGLGTSTMELFATAFYVFERYGEDAANVERIRELKPRFSEPDIRDALIRVQGITAALRA